uniref:fibrinogen C domain-containing protein 1-B-like n=1 Tax=Styela clava TaxID=7725 RepID=UPI00193A2465|nr:fibrinogen C domain-containing protein 1-B-like [Styela clava]
MMQYITSAEKIRFCDEVSSCLASQQTNDVEAPLVLSRNTLNKDGNSGFVDYELINAKILEQITEAEQRLDVKLSRLEAKLAQLKDGSLPRSCRDIQTSGQESSNEKVYNISLAALPRSTDVSCDQTTDGGGWIVFQRRVDGSEDFYRNWDDYVEGFGNKDKEFWLGLENIHNIVKRGNHELRIDMEDWEGNTSYAKYGSFYVGDSSNNYRLTIGEYSGNAGDALGNYQHQNMQFTTKDADHDTHQWGNCAQLYHGAFWYGTCHNANLNGLYVQGGQSYQRAVATIWHPWKGHFYSLKSVEMKMREKI